jgi:hypothetical protein
MAQQEPTDTLYIGQLDQKVTKRTLYDLCIQVNINSVTNLSIVNADVIVLLRAVSVSILAS